MNLIQSKHTKFSSLDGETCADERGREGERERVLFI